MSYSFCYFFLSLDQESREATFRVEVGTKLVEENLQIVIGPTFLHLGHWIAAGDTYFMTFSGALTESALGNTVMSAHSNYSLNGIYYHDLLNLFFLSATNHPPNHPFSTNARALFCEGHLAKSSGLYKVAVAQISG